MNKRYIILAAVFLATFLSGMAQESNKLRVKTLIVWATLSDTEQAGGSAITIDDQEGHFDGIVYGERHKYKWMAGSEAFNRVQDDQEKNAKEESENIIIQMAIVYNERGEISIYRNGKLYTSYVTDVPLVYLNTSAIVFGMRHIEAQDTKNSFTGKIKDARIYAKALSQAEIASLKPGMESSVPGLWAWWDFSGGSLQEKTHRFNDLKVVGNPSIKDGFLVLPGNGASLIAYNQADSNTLPDGKAVSGKMLSMNKAFRNRLLSDPYRPAYHFCFPEDDGSTGDPNGAFYKDGQYHLMYLHKDKDGFKWGHVSSTDLLHWRFHPDAIGPGEGDEGCFSGGAFVDDDGSVTLSYWMLWENKGIGLATSKDYYHEKWEKYKGNPVIKSDSWGVTEMKDAQGRNIHVGSADPSNIWKKDGKYYMVTGNLLVLHRYGLNDSIKDEQGDRVYLFESTDLKNWKYRHRFYESKREWTAFNEDNMCPSFFPLPKSPDGGKPSDKHLMLFISHNKGCQYYIGDYKNDKFYPERHGRMTWNDHSFFAPEALMDGKGRQIMWSWIFDGRPDSLIRYSGWAGTYSLPRTLWLGNDGNLRIAPVKELENLRLNPRSFSNLKVNPGKETKLNEPSKELMEMEIQFDPNKASQFGVKVYQSEDGREETVIYYDSADKKLKVDTRKSCVKAMGRKILEEAPLELNANEPLTLRIFIDKSVIEVFANNRQAIARLVYPTLGGKGISLFSEGGNVNVKSVKLWEMSPSNPF